MRAATLLATLPMVALAAPSKRAPLIVPRDAQLIDGKYIVKMKTHASTASISSSIQSIAADADHVYNNFGGFAASLTSEEVESLRNNPDVEYIEQNAKATTFDTQENADWGLARLSNIEPGSTTYTYDASAGEGVCAYSVDTGIDVDHPDFEGRATWATSFVSGATTDDNGHGTHTSGTIGGATYGVAKKVSLYAVKVLDSGGSGEYADVIAGMDYVVTDAPSRDCPNGVVVNMSLGGSFSQAVNDAADGITSAGIFLAVAAGNGNIFGIPQDASGYSPASAESACTVGATDSDDNVASFSNYGSVVDIYAPGVDIESDLPDGETAVESGTSMAAPHIAGLAAYFLGTGASGIDGLCEYIASLALSGVISGVPSDTVNLLAQNGEA